MTFLSKTTPTLPLESACRRWYLASTLKAGGGVEEGPWRTHFRRRDLSKFLHDFDNRAETAARASNLLIDSSSVFVREFGNRAVTAVRAIQSCCACSEGKKSVS